MAYRNKVFISFDGDNDIHYYRLMRAWKQNDYTDFNFFDAHDINTARDTSLAVRGETPRCTEIGGAPAWQGATREQIGAFVTPAIRSPAPPEAGCSANRMQRGFCHGLLARIIHEGPESPPRTV